MAYFRINDLPSSAFKKNLTSITIQPDLNILSTKLKNSVKILWQVGGEVMYILGSFVVVWLTLLKIGKAIRDFILRIFLI